MLSLIWPHISQWSIYGKWTNIGFASRINDKLNTQSSFQLLTGKFTAMITPHFHLQPQYKYELFHINFTSFHCTRRYELNKLISRPMCGFIAQLVEHSTGIAEVTGSNRVETLICFQASSFQLLKLENFLRWSLFTFIYNRSTNMNYFI